MAVNLLVAGQVKKAFFNLKQGIASLAPKITKKAATILQSEIINEIQNVDAIASEDLVKSIDVLYEFSDSQYFLEVGSDAPQAFWIEFGRKPSAKMPPADRIYQWMVDKGIEGTFSDAFRIARGIQEKGYAPREPFTKAYFKALPKIENYLGKVVSTELKVDF